jgi:hypothetical protein
LAGKFQETLKLGLGWVRYSHQDYLRKLDEI